MPIIENTEETITTIKPNKPITFDGLLRDTMSLEKTNTVDDWMALVEAFRGEVTKTQKTLSKHEVAGRSILYKQLADAYKIGLELISDANPDQTTKYVQNFRVLRHLMYRHSMSKATKNLDVISTNNHNRLWNSENPDEPQRELEPEISPWVYIVKLLYGQWADSRKWTDVERQENGKSVGLNTDDVRDFLFNKDAPDVQPTSYQVWTANRSAEKYAVVFRYLHSQGKTPDEVASFIENYSHPTHGNRLRGIEAAGRAEANAGTVAKEPSKAVIDQRNAYVVRAENRKNLDVFAVEKPNTWPSKVAYAKAVLKVDGDELVIVGFKEMDEKAYTNHAVKLGKPLLDEENKKAAKKKAEVESVMGQAVTSMKSEGIDRDIAELEIEGGDSDEIYAEINDMIARRKTALANSKAIEGFVDPDPA